MVIGNKTRQFEKFIRLLAALTPVEMCGVAKILGVSFGTKDQHREFADVYEDMLDAFLRLRYKQRQNLLSLLEEAKNDQSEDSTDNA